MGDVAPNCGLTRAGKDHVRIGFGDLNGADGSSREEAIGDVLPEGAAIGGFPDAAGTGAEVEGHGIGGMPGHRHDPSAPMGANAAILEAGQIAGMVCRGSVSLRHAVSFVYCRFMIGCSSVFRCARL